VIAAARHRRFVVLGDSVAEGVGDAVAGYPSGGWADAVARGLGPRTAYLNLGRRRLLAREVRDTQLQPALTFFPDLAAVVCGGNDLMRGVEPARVQRDVDAIVATLRAVGCPVLMLAPFDITRSAALPPGRRADWHALIDALGDLAARVADRRGATLLDFRGHPAAGDAGIYSRDGIHLNARGHAIVADAMLQRLVGDAEPRAA
jgi:lysophospholipase L1-like esterase